MKDDLHFEGPMWRNVNMAKMERIRQQQVSELEERVQLTKQQQRLAEQERRLREAEQQTNAEKAEQQKLAEVAEKQNLAEIAEQRKYAEGAERQILSETARPEGIVGETEQEHVTETGKRRKSPRQDKSSKRQKTHQAVAGASNDTMSAEDNTDTANPPSPDMTNPAPPEWYTKITPQQNQRNPRAPPGIDQHLNKIKSGIENCVKAVSKGLPPDAADYKRINDALHKAFFLNLNAAMIRKQRLLHNDTGLPKLFCQALSDGVNYPWYIAEDAAELYIKWWSGDFNPDLFRGIVKGRKKNEELHRTSKADKLDRKTLQSRRNGNFFGNGHLRNGQWWPNQLCAFRDGAHNSPQGGIWGSNDGAYSCVMSDGDYPNIDNGEEVFYYGTLADKGASEPTRHTKQMIRNIINKQPIRLLLSAKMHTESTSPYRPAEGMRYDGLYQVVSYEIKNLDAQAHLFKLVRLPDQGTIRFQGPEIRPTPEELQALDEARRDRAFLV